MITCAGCGSSYEDTYKFCPYCGRTKPEQKKAFTVDVQVREAPSPNSCPICGRVDKVMKVKSIFQQETHEFVGSIPVTETYSDDYGSIRTRTSSERISASQQSGLAKKISAPARPEGRSQFLFKVGIMFGFILLGVFLPAFLLNLSEKFLVGNEFFQTVVKTFALIIIVVSFIGVWIILFLANRKNDKQLAKDTEVWERQVARWGQLYYCSRDDSLFIPGEPHAAPPERMMEIISH